MGEDRTEVSGQWRHPMSETTHGRNLVRTKLGTGFWEEEGKFGTKFETKFVGRSWGAGRRRTEGFDEAPAEAPDETIGEGFGKRAAFSMEHIEDGGRRDLGRRKGKFGTKLSG